MSETVGTEVEVESIFEDALGLFGARKVALGQPGGEVEYIAPAPTASGTKLRLRLPSADHHELFAHYIWNGATWLADQIALGYLEVRMKTVLELGAGAGLPSLVCAVKDARRVVITDYPDPHILSTLRENVAANLPVELQHKCVVVGHKWGEDTSDVLSAGFRDLVCLSEETRHSDNMNEEGVCVKQSLCGFDVVLFADTMWLSSQHAALLQTCSALLAPHGEIWAVGSDHQGTGALEKFLKLAVSDYFMFHLQHEETIQLQSAWSPSGNDVTHEQSSEDQSSILHFYKLTKSFN